MDRRGSEFPAWRSPVEINSQTLFADGYVQEKTGDAAFRKKYKQYMVPVEGVEGVYKVAFESLWENCFSEMGYREFKRDLYNGNLFEGVRAAAVGKHDVLLKESAADICSKLASLLKSLKDLLTVSLYGNKGKFEEDDLRSILRRMIWMFLLPSVLSLRYWSPG